MYKRDSTLVVKTLFLLQLSLLLFFSAANASENDPTMMLEQVSQQLFIQLKSEQDIIEQRPQRLFELVDEIIGPHVNFIRVSRWVLGKYWRQATSEQKKLFILEFHTLLIRFYIAALLVEPKELDKLFAHTDNLIHFKPAAVNHNQDKVRVHAEVHLPSGMRIPVIFRMHLSKKKQWKIVDLTVDGISLVSTYRSSFATEIRRNDLDKMLTDLTERNQKLLNPEKVKE